MSRGLVIAAPSSGSGKTMVTLALLRLLRRRGLDPASAKVGPDYIDPAFHAAASGRTCRNLDPWAMRSGTLAGLARQDCGLLVCEGVMGLFDGPGSTAEIAALTGWPVILVIDCAGMSGSAAAIAKGFAEFRQDVAVAGFLLNRVAGDRHRAMLAEAFDAAGLPVLGFLPRAPELALPSRHLGLVQAGEHADLEAFLERAADWAEAHVDLAALLRLATPCRLQGGEAVGIPPPGQKIAVARDSAFAFAYPTLLDAWRAQGAEIAFFSPLADEAPSVDADAIYLPGGYPELHAARLAANCRFLAGLRQAAGFVYGECGGYMVLGRGLTDAEGQRHEMAGLLPVETSFAARKRHLGYRQATSLADTKLGAAGSGFRGHEFHYASLISAEGPGLFAVRDAAGADLGIVGQSVGKVAGSFIHLIDCR